MCKDARIDVCGLLELQLPGTPLTGISGSTGLRTNEVWQEAEVQKSWLEGPLSEEEVGLRYGPLFAASPRFGLKQADKDQTHRRYVYQLGELFLFT